MTRSSSPPRSHTNDSSSSSSKDERPRFFDAEAKKLCWAKADVVPGRHPERWRKDAAGNVVCKRFYNCMGCMCYEYDHIVPYSKGGESVAENCQILQTRVNRYKGNHESLENSVLKGYSCDISYTEEQLDLVEMAVYGDVIRPGKQCRVRTLAEMLGRHKSKNHMDVCEWPLKEAS